MDGDRTKPDIAFLKNHFYREGRLTEEQALFILRKCVVVCWLSMPKKAL
jgi:serine/threonine-protein phosphatase 2B catalytic subunit